MSEFKMADFQRTQFTHREEKIKVPDLAQFFNGDPVWTVRGLTGEELAQVNESAEKAKKLQAIAEGLVAGDAKEQTAAIRELLGHGGETPIDLDRRLTMLTIASVNPVIDRPAAVKLADAYPVEFQTLTTKIMLLTGQGKQPGKLPGSGATTESEPPLSSATIKDDSSTKSCQTSSPADA